MKQKTLISSELVETLPKYFLKNLWREAQNRTGTIQDQVLELAAITKTPSLRFKV